MGKSILSFIVNHIFFKIFDFNVFFTHYFFGLWGIDEEIGNTYYIYKWTWRFHVPMTRREMINIFQIKNIYDDQDS